MATVWPRCGLGAGDMQDSRRKRVASAARNPHSAHALTALCPLPLAVQAEILSPAILAFAAEASSIFTGPEDSHLRARGIRDYVGDVAFDDVVFRVAVFAVKAAVHCLAFTLSLSFLSDVYPTRVSMAKALVIARFAHRRRRWRARRGRRRRRQVDARRRRRVVGRRRAVAPKIC